MLAQEMPFPRTRPPGYEQLPDEPRYEPDRHLALEPPGTVWELADFGYDPASISVCASPIAITGPFRIMSEEGLAALRQVTLALADKRTRLEGNRVPLHLAGGVYRSAFLRDFCRCPVIGGFLSRIAGTPLAPHSMPSQQLYINYAPDDISKAVDAWHFDAIGFDYVLLLSDPAGLEGGRFEFFRGTKSEAAAILGLDPERLHAGGLGELPADRVTSTEFPAAGYAIFQQGNMVVHRATRLLRPAERITLVPGFVCRDVRFPDPNDTAIMPDYGEPGIETELARHAAWLAQAKLGTLIEELGFTEDRAALRAALRDAVADVARAIRHLEPEPTST